MGLWRYVKDQVFGPSDPFWTVEEEASELEQSRKEAENWRELYYALRRQITGYEAALDTKERRCLALEQEVRQLKSVGKR